jgi:ketosteroid isomerase-like protein
MSDLERLLAYEEIRQLAARYAVAVDSRDLDALVGLFVEDVKVTPERRGREALREQFEPHLRADRVSILNIGTHVINLIDADHATGVVYCKAELGDQHRWVHQAIAYHDRYRRERSHWYFVRRDHQLFYGIDVGLRPLAEPPANWPVSPVGRGTVPERWSTWQAYTSTPPG